MNEILELYRACRLCPRECGADRLQGGLGFCGETAGMRIAWAGLHYGEEPVLAGSGGSGAVFFTGCTLKCGFCQNSQLSRGGLGIHVTVEDLASLMLGLQEAGAHNLDLVTGTHFLPGILEALRRARGRGLILPALWNSSGFEKEESLRLLLGEVDLFLPDCKTLDPELSRSLFDRPDYPEAARQTLGFLARAKPLRLEGERLKSGVVVRHLVLPGFLEATRRFLEWFREELYGRALLSLLFQYLPPEGEGAGRAPPARRINAAEYEEVCSWLESLGIEEGLLQEPETDDSWRPDFSRLNPFPEGRARPLWHYRRGRLSGRG